MGSARDREVTATVLGMTRRLRSDDQRRAALAVIGARLVEFAQCAPLTLGSESLLRRVEYGSRDWYPVDAVHTAQLLRLRMVAEFLVGRRYNRLQKLKPANKWWHAEGVYAVDFVEPWPPECAGDEDMLARYVCDLDARTCHLAWQGEGCQYYDTEHIDALVRMLRLFLEQLEVDERVLAVKLRASVDQLEAAVDALS